MNETRLKLRDPSIGDSFFSILPVGAGLVSARNTDLVRNQNLESTSGGNAERANTRLAPTNSPSSLRALGVIELLAQMTEDGKQKTDNSDAFAKLEADVKSGKSLNDAFANLNQSEQSKIEAKLGNGYLAEFLSMSEETHDRISYENLLHFDQAIMVLGDLAQASSLS